MFCFHCGAKVTEDCRHCPQCGKFIAVEEDPTPPPPAPQISLPVAPAPSSSPPPPPLPATAPIPAVPTSGRPPAADPRVAPPPPGDPQVAPPPKKAAVPLKGKPAKKGSQGCVILAAGSCLLTGVAVAAALFLLYSWWQGSLPLGRPAVTNSPTAPGPSLADLAGRWEVEPSDPAYSSSDRDQNLMELKQDGSIIVAHHGRDEIFRLTRMEGRVATGPFQAEGSKGVVTVTIDAGGRSLQLAGRLDNGKEIKVRFRR